MRPSKAIKVLTERKNFLLLTVKSLPPKSSRCQAALREVAALLLAISVLYKQRGYTEHYRPEDERSL